MSTTTAHAGGFLVRYELDPQIIIANAGAVSPLRQIGRVVTTAFSARAGSVTAQRELLALHERLVAAGEGEGGG
ncbi:MAG: hypothetical protein ACJ76M_01595 [Solirubrobacteraceae bacterium]